MSALGIVMIGHQDGAWTPVMYVTSEADAREGERNEPPREFENVSQEMDELSVGETIFHDIREPVLQPAD